ncbi:MAG: DUF4856 domain-containing protein [Bacteroidetes bacterium]|nr:DUF4856 domain-containing protein [Bacteroidota bacterium]
MKIASVAIFTLVALPVFLTSCKKEGCTDETANNYSSKAKIDDGSCTYTVSSTSNYTIPTTYTFTDVNGNNTVDYSGQTERLNQLSEIIELVESGKTGAINSQDLLDMYVNTGGNGNNNFSFSSSKQLKDKTFAPDQSFVETLLQNAATASLSYNQTAQSGQAGVLTTGTKSYLIDENGMDVAEVIEKVIMGSVFMNQALNVYFGAEKMNVNNTTAVDPTAGKYYTTMQHHWDESFGYFGVSTTFPSTLPTSFWGKYCNSQNTSLNSNADMMNNYLKGRAAIGANVLLDRDAAIEAIRKEWEDISANQALTYLNLAITSFGTDNAKYFHVLSEAYGFCYNLRYSPEGTRRLNNTEHTALMSLFSTNFWDMTVGDINSIKAVLTAKY